MSNTRGMAGRHPYPDTNPLGRLANSNGFQHAILLLIGAAAVLIGLETDKHLMSRHGDLILLLDKIILWLFVAEALLKMAAHGRHFYRYFRDPWNLFDFAIIAVCFMPFDGHYAAVLRLARILRALRLVSAVPALQLLVGSLLKSIPSMFYVGALLIILFYMYAVTGVFLFRYNDPFHFGDLPTSLLSLFRVVTLEDWTDIMYIQMYGSANYPNYAELGPRADGAVSKEMPMAGAAFFVSFVMIGTMVMLNLFIGVIINSMDEARKETAEDRRLAHISATGQASVGDDLNSLERDLEALTERLRLLRSRVGKD